MNVEDANDHSPYFTNPLYEASVFESAALGSAVLQVTALDKDKGENAELIYTIEAGESCCTDCSITHGTRPSSIYHLVTFTWLLLEHLQLLFFWPSNCPSCMMVGYKILGISIICFPSLTARKEFPFISFNLRFFWDGKERRNV